MKKLPIINLFIALGAGGAFAQSRAVTAPNGQTFPVKGTDGFRGTDELWLYTPAFYAAKPPSNAGVDVLVVGDRVAEIRARAGAVFLQNKPDPGPLAVAGGGYVLSGNGAARRWILANLKTGDAVGLDGKTPVSTADPFAYPGYGVLQAANGRTVYPNGRNAPRAQNSIIVYTPDFYQKTPPNEAGVDILIANGAVVAVQDRADAVFLKKQADPGPLKIAEPAGALIVSGNGEGRKWLLENLRAGEAATVGGLDPAVETAPLKKLPCFDGAHYRKAVSSFDVWTGIAGFVKLGTPQTDEARIDAGDKQPLDNFSVYMGGNAGGKFEVDAGLSWEFTVDESGRKSARRNAYRPFWRAQNGGWNAAPARPEFYFYPGETVQMAVLVAGPKKLRLVISDGKTKTFQTEFDAPGFVAGLPRQFKRVNAIDQRFNEGKPTQTTRAEVTGAEWLGTVLLRGEGAAARQLPLTAARMTDMRCSNGTIGVTATDAAKGAEKIDLFGFVK